MQLRAYCVLTTHTMMLFIYIYCSTPPSKSLQAVSGRVHFKLVHAPTALQFEPPDRLLQVSSSRPVFRIYT